MAWLNDQDYGKRGMAQMLKSAVPMPSSQTASNEFTPAASAVSAPKTSSSFGNMLNAIIPAAAIGLAMSSRDPKVMDNLQRTMLTGYKLKQEKDTGRALQLIGQYDDPFDAMGQIAKENLQIDPSVSYGLLRDKYKLKHATALAMTKMLGEYQMRSGLAKERQGFDERMAREGRTFKADEAAKDRASRAEQARLGREAAAERVQPTEAGMVDKIMNTPPEDRTSDQQRMLDAYLTRKKSGGITEAGAANARRDAWQKALKQATDEAGFDPKKSTPDAIEARAKTLYQQSMGKYYNQPEAAPPQEAPKAGSAEDYLQRKMGARAATPTEQVETVAGIPIFKPKRVEMPRRIPPGLR